jgi:hypothetical protein
MPSRKFTDPLNAQELETANNYYDWLMNDATSYNNQRSYQYKNLIKKIDKGIYDTEKGVKMFLHLTNRNKPRFFNGALYPNVRYKTAQLIEQNFMENYNLYR